MQSETERFVASSKEKTNILTIRPEELLEIICIPSVEAIVKETGSTILLDADEQAAQISITDAQGSPWFLYKLRERTHDGPGWKPTRLTTWAYDKPVDTFFLGHAVEESTYWLDPRHPLTEVFTLEESAFVRDPFAALEGLKDTTSGLIEWISLWKRLAFLDQSIYPGYFMRHKIPGLRAHILQQTEHVLFQKGYEYLTAVPTWYHTAHLYEHFQFSYQYHDDGNLIHRLSQQINQAVPGSLTIKSWVVMAQFWAQACEEKGLTPENFLNPQYLMRHEDGTIQTYPLSPERNIWMYKKL